MDFQKICDQLELEAPKENEKLIINALLAKTYNIPENERMYSDKGDELIRNIIAYLEAPGIIPDGINVQKEIELLRKLFSEQHINFNAVKQVKIKLLCKIKARNPMLLKPQKPLVGSIESFLMDLEETFPKTSYSDEEEAMLSYLTALEYDASQQLQ